MMIYCREWSEETLYKLPTFSKQSYTWSPQTLINLFLQIVGPAGPVGLGREEIFVTKLLRDGLEFPNTILENESRLFEDGLCNYL